MKFTPAVELKWALAGTNRTRVSASAPRTSAEFTDSDPLFPRDGLSHNGEYSISRGFLSAKHWRTAAPVRKIVRAAFVACGLKPYPPHRFRDTLADLGRRHCRTSDEQMAWAQNLGHKHFATTFGSYGNLSPERQFQLIEAFRDPAQDDEKLLGLTVDKLVGLLSPKLLERLEAESGRKEAD